MANRGPEDWWGQGYNPSWVLMKVLVDCRPRWVLVSESGGQAADLMGVLGNPFPGIAFLQRTRKVGGGSSGW